MTKQFNSAQAFKKWVAKFTTAEVHILRARDGSSYTITKTGNGHLVVLPVDLTECTIKGIQIEQVGFFPEADITPGTKYLKKEYGKSIAEITQIGAWDVR